MKERPILMNGQMAIATLENRKRQTRRTQGLDAINREPSAWELVELVEEEGDLYAHFVRKKDTNKVICEVLQIKSRYGVPGDRLWVRETVVLHTGMKGRYLADGEWFTIPRKHKNFYLRRIGKGLVKTPSIHMPRWAYRILLEVVEVRVERVQKIRGQDAQAEGWPRYKDLFPTVNTNSKALCWFQDLWDSINAKRGFGWDVNPWVWVVTFKRVEGEG